MDTLIVTPIKDDDNLLNTINLHIKLRKLKEVMLLCWIIKLLSISSVDKYSKKHLKVREADNYSSLYYFDSNSDTATRKIRIKASQLRKVSKEEELAKTKKEKREKEDSFSARKNEVVIINSANSILCDLSDLLIIRFCIFSNSALENIGILTNKKVVEMQTNTTTALANKLAAVNKLIILEANTPAIHLKAIKHCLALLVAQFIIVCSFRKVDKHVFRAYNTISVIAQRTIIRKGGSYIEKRTVFNKFYNCKLEGIIIAKFY
ncbi:hypothetical protein HBI16_109310 [Parastagonospora nodorum]|nr:hypothetical protein HBI16_109310 [Parastagonospora nodorum]